MSDLVYRIPELPYRPPQPHYAAPGLQEDVEDSSALLEYWHILSRHKGKLILAGFLGLLLAILVTLPQTRIYQAKATLEIQNLNQDFMNLKDVSPVNESGSYNQLFDIQTQIRILQSDSLIDRTVEKLKAKYPDLVMAGTSRIDAWRKALNLPEAEPKPAIEKALEKARDKLRVRTAGQTRIVEIFFDSPDPKLAADFVNTLANEYIEQNLEARWQMSQRTGEWLSRQLEDMRVKLERSEDALQSYARQAGILITSENENVAEQKLAQLQTALTIASQDRVLKQSRLEMAETAPPETLGDVLNDSSLRVYQEKLTDLRRQLAELSTTYTPNHASVQRVTAQIETLERALERNRAMILKRIKNDYEEAVRREKLLADDYAAQSKVVREQSERSIQYNILKREVDSNRQLYESMLQRVKESSIASAIRASNVRIVDPAKPPEKPYKPRATVNGAVGLLAGLFFGVAGIVLKERMDRTLKDASDITFWLKLPQLGTIPSTAEGRKRLLYLRKKSLPTGETSLTIGPKSDERPELVTLQRKSSVVAEAFRALLTSIMLSGENGNRPKVIVSTSANPGEGKTTVTCNLGIALAEINRKVLIIDADMRKPRIAEVFGVPGDQGLSDVLKERVVDVSRLESLIQPAGLPNLYVLPSGPPTSSAANLLYSPAMHQILRYLESQFDVVLADTPPALHMPDARILGRLAGGVLLIARAGHTIRDTLQAIQDRLVADGINVLGVVLNDWKPGAGGSGYGQYKYYRSYYNSYGSAAD
ncbi:MAG: polysaccharide biosynthesis tyrosine autokinase [Bryobacteraceae bacterium]|nr:polysaccharide biosynthesis tyrosine autokinase [Bryobacteraceae bacterium]